MKLKFGVRRKLDCEILERKCEIFVQIAKEMESSFQTTYLESPLSRSMAVTP